MCVGQLSTSFYTPQEQVGMCSEQFWQTQCESQHRASNKGWVSRSTCFRDISDISLDWWWTKKAPNHSAQTCKQLLLLQVLVYRNHCTILVTCYVNCTLLKVLHTTFFFSYATFLYLLPNHIAGKTAAICSQVMVGISLQKTVHLFFFCMFLWDLFTDL